MLTEWTSLNEGGNEKEKKMKKKEEIIEKEKKENHMSYEKLDCFSSSNNNLNECLNSDGINNYNDNPNKNDNNNYNNNYMNNSDYSKFDRSDVSDFSPSKNTNLVHMKTPIYSDTSNLVSIEECATSNTFFWIAITIKFSLLFICIIFSFFSLSFSHIISIWIERCLAWVKHQGAWSPILFAIFYCVGTVLFLPSEILTVGAGFLFCGAYGRTRGFLVALLSCTIGLYCSSAISFMVSRYLLYSSVYRLFYMSRIYHAFCRAVQEGGTYFVFLVRLSPLLPLTASNYVFGLTTLKFRQLMLGTTSTLLPGAIFIWAGSKLNDIRQLGFHLTYSNIMVLCGAVLLATVAVGYIVLLTRRKLRSYDRQLPIVQ